MVRVRLELQNSTIVSGFAANVTQVTVYEARASRCVFAHSSEPRNQRRRLPTPRSRFLVVSPVYDERRLDLNGSRGEHYELYRRDTYRDREHDRRGRS